MAFFKALILFLMQLSLLLLHSTALVKETVIPPIPHHPQSPAMSPTHPHHHHHHSHHQPYPPTHAPTPAPHHHHHRPHNIPPTHPPVHPPLPGHYSHPPTLAPHPHGPAHSPTFHFPRALVAVQGVVYCKSSCKHAMVDNFMGDSPLKGASVKVQCNNTKYPTVAKGLTDEHGYFFIEAPKTITNYGAHKCKASLVSSPNATCSLPTNLQGGVSGGLLRPEKLLFISKIPFGLFTVGPFAFEPKCPH